MKRIKASFVAMECASYLFRELNLKHGMALTRTEQSTVIDLLTKYLNELSASNVQIDPTSETVQSIFNDPNGIMKPVHVTIASHCLDSVPHVIDGKQPVIQERVIAQEVMNPSRRRFGILGVVFPYDTKFRIDQMTPEMQKAIDHAVYNFGSSVGIHFSHLNNQ